MTKYKCYKINITDPYGENGVDDLLNGTIAEVCKKSGVSPKDFDVIAEAFRKACEKAYENGRDEERFED